MPRSKKAAGTAIDKRNGQRAIDTVGRMVAVERFELPPGLAKIAYEAWDDFWQDRQALLLTTSSKIVLKRWVMAVNRYDRAIKEADQQPLVEGSARQMIMNPMYKIAKDALATIDACERQLGIGTLNATNLGMAALAEQARLADLNEAYEEPREHDEGARQRGAAGPTLPGTVEDDPRLLSDDQLVS